MFIIIVGIVEVLTWISSRDLNQSLALQSIVEKINNNKKFKTDNRIFKSLVTLHVFMLLIIKIQKKESMKKIKNPEESIYKKDLHNLYYLDELELAFGISYLYYQNQTL